MRGREARYSKKGKSTVSSPPPKQRPPKIGESTMVNATQPECSIQTQAEKHDHYMDACACACKLGPIPSAALAWPHETSQRHAIRYRVITRNPRACKSAFKTLYIYNVCKYPYQSICPVLFFYIYVKEESGTHRLLRIHACMQFTCNKSTQFNNTH